MSYQSLSKLGQLVEEINNAIDDELSEEEINELIAQYQHQQENEVESIYAAIKFCDLEEESIKDKMRGLSNQKTLVEKRRDYLKKYFTNYIDQYGTIQGKAKSKSIKGEYFNFVRVVTKKVKENLQVFNVPNQFWKFKLTSWLDESTFNKVCDKIEGTIKYEEEIDKQGLAKYAKENGKEEEFLEDNPHFKAM